MKIARVTGSYGLLETTGPAKQQALLDKGLICKGHKVTVYTYNGKVKEDFDKLEVKRYIPILRFYGLAFSYDLFRDLIRTDADIIHSHGYRNFLTDTAALTAFELKKPLVMTAHGSIAGFRYIHTSSLLDLPNLAYDAFTFKASLRLASYVVVSSTIEAIEAVEFGLPNEKIRIIPHAVEAPGFVTQYVRDSSRKRRALLMVTRITAKNNLEFLLRAFHSVKKEVPDAELAIVGDELPSSQIGLEKGYKFRVLSLLQKLGLIDSVQFTGWLTGNELWKQYLNADVFLWTSKYDNFAHALVEAALSGLPIVSTQVGVAPEIVGRNQGGFIVANNDIEGMKKSIVKLLIDNSFYENASKYVLSKAKRFSVDLMVDRYEALYREALSKSNFKTFNFNNSWSKNRL